MSKTALVLTFLLLLGTLSMAQSPNVEPATTPEKRVPNISFEYTLAGADPGAYSLTVESTGAAAYRADDETGPNATPSGDPYIQKFVLSPATAQRIFDLARSLNYFHGDFEYHGGRVANMGAKTLIYRDAGAESRTSYNYSTNPQMQQLTAIFQGIATTLAHGRRLERLYRFDKLGLDAELRAFENDVKNKFATEIQVDGDILNRIANDSAVMNISRRRAQELISMVHTQEQAKQ